jgi:hypothetical protein
MPLLQVASPLTLTDTGTVLTISVSARIITAITADTNAGTDAGVDFVYFAQTPGITLYLPAAAACVNSYKYKNSSGGAVFAASSFGELIDTNASPIQLNAGQELEFISDGTNWGIF